MPDNKCKRIINIVLNNMNYLKALSENKELFERKKKNVFGLLVIVHSTSYQNWVINRLAPKKKNYVEQIGLN